MFVRTSGQICLPVTGFQYPGYFVVQCTCGCWQIRYRWWCMFVFRGKYSRNIILRLIVLGGLAIAGLVASMPFITEFYINNQLTSVGWVVNSGIVLLFVLGISKIIFSLLRYMSEEAALVNFAKALEQDREEPDLKVRSHSVIGQRYHTIRELSRQNAPINHSALASMLVAQESTRTSFPRYIHHILILTGVFGTIISLSISMIGASRLLQAAQDVESMGLVIHGMSTALSTTMTAIVCYLFFGYFYMKLNDVQANFLSGVEQVTSLFLLPRFAQNPDAMLHEVASLIRGLRSAAESMQVTQGHYAEATQRVGEMLAEMQSGGGGSSDIQEIKQLLRSGFRLPENGQ